ncbi:Glucocerebrosidase 1b [Carabus blaptoides fortunei]
MVKCAIVILCASLVFVTTLGCNLRDYGNGGQVCVCTKDDCDTIPESTLSNSDSYEIYTSSLAGDRFERNNGTFEKSNSASANATLIINRNKKYQKIHGFGGAFTDSTGINLLTLSNQTRQTLIRAYFAHDGLQYSMGRIPMAGTDFSTRGYTYDDVDDDFELKFFKLQIEDYDYKIPFIKEALKMTNNDMKLFGSAWTSPVWMKTNDRLSGIGFLNLSMYDVWAEYFIKFLDAYKDNGIKLWGLTTGNEPANGFNGMLQINDMGWVPLLQAQWIAENLGPKIRLNPNYSDTKIMIVDDQRVYYPWIPRYIFQNEVTESYVDGCAVHYYTDKYVSADVLSITHYDYPDKFILATEACEGSSAQQSVILGSWDRAENYLNSIIDDLNNWSTGWMDWNMALNLEGGPTYVNNFVDSPIIVNKTADEFYKQPMYYALGHFAKFVRPDSVRVHSIYTGQGLKSVVFQQPAGTTVVSIFNPTDADVDITISDEKRKDVINLVIKKRSINSVLYI